MTWIIISGVIFLAAMVAIAVIAKRRTFAGVEIVAQNVERRQAELAARTLALTELGNLALGMMDGTQFQEIQSRLAARQEELRAERSRISIATTEIDAVDRRLKELEELRRELESSALDAGRELEYLRSQEKELLAANADVSAEIDASLEVVEDLAEQLAGTPDIAERLAATKEELISAEGKLAFFNGQVSFYNENYINLKKAYDALDIEYAQLYEKQQSAE